MYKDISYKKVFGIKLNQFVISLFYTTGKTVSKNIKKYQKVPKSKVLY